MIKGGAAVAGDVVRYCKMGVKQLRGLGACTRIAKRGGYTFIKSNAAKPFPVLGVAHIDTVVALPLAGGAAINAAHTVAGSSVWSMALDDRLGVWALLEGLPRALGFAAGVVPYDVLLTECEEVGASTADDFRSAGGLAGYGWAFSFDRAGADAVRYGFTDPVWVRALRGDGWDVGLGSYSCISEFELGDISAVNFGVGYTDQHTALCCVDLDVALWQCVRVAHFVRAWGRVKFAHSGVGRYDYVDGWGSYGGYSSARAGVVDGSGADVKQLPLVASQRSVGRWADNGYWDREYSRYRDAEIDLYGVDDVPAVAAGRKRGYRGV